MDYLNDAEKAAIQAFCENPTMYEAVKKVLLDNIYGQDVLKAGSKADPMHSRALVIVQESASKSDEQIGQRMRAFAEAVSLLQHGFNQLATFKKVEPESKPKPNRAR
jgi:hypothetical protein